MDAVILKWIETIGSLILSWPVMVLIIALLFRRPVINLFQRLTQSSEGKAEFGPVKLELGKLAQEGKTAVDNLRRLNVVMGETRLLELEITEQNFGRGFTSDQQKRMREQIAELKQLIEDAKAEAKGNG